MAVQPKSSRTVAQVPVQRDQTPTARPQRQPAPKPLTKAVFAPRAQYTTGRPQSPLKAVLKETPAANGQDLISHGRAVAFLDRFLASKVRNKV